MARQGAAARASAGAAAAAARASRRHARARAHLSRAQDKSNNGPYSLNYTYYFNVAANIDPVRNLPGAA